MARGDRPYAISLLRARRGGVKVGGTFRLGTLTTLMFERRGLGIGRAVNGRVNAFQHTVHVVDKVVVREADDAIARRLEPARARLIACDIFAQPML